MHIALQRGSPSATPPRTTPFLRRRYSTCPESSNVTPFVVAPRVSMSGPSACIFSAIAP